MEKCFEVIWIFQENSYNAQKRGKLCIFASESIFLKFSSNLFDFSGITSDSVGLFWIFKGNSY